MPHLAFDIAFCQQLEKLEKHVRNGVFDAWEKFERLTLDQLFKDPGLKLESLRGARDRQIRTIRITQGYRGVVLAPETGDTFVLLRVGPHDEATEVNVGTMHTFKGLEYRCTAVIGVHDRALPNPSAVTPEEVDRLQHEADLAAERCLLFVTCTRARDGLYVSWAGQPSPFLVEAGCGTT